MVGQDRTKKRIAPLTHIRHRPPLRIALFALSAAALATGCGTSHHAAASPSPPSTSKTPSTSTTLSPVAAAGSKLIPLLIKPPDGYATDTTDTGANGSFSASAAGGSTLAKGFRAGYLRTYTNPATSEAILVTIMKFDSPADASAYSKATSSRTLSVVAARPKAFTQVPGAIELDGTKADNGLYEHGVVLTHGVYYASVVYAATNNGPVPFEFYDWAKVQYVNLG